MPGWALPGARLLVIHELMRHADDPDTMRCLGFCVSVAHARYMAERFRHHGIEAVAVTGDTPEPERRQALADLAAGRVRMVFSVDLFNEGVDVPAIDTVLMLRPTESPTLFLQQLDRKASEIVIRSLREAIPSPWPAKVEELRLLRRERPEPTLAEFLDETGLDLPDVYDGGRTWSDLCEAAGVPTSPAGEHEVPIRRAVGRLLHVDDDERIGFYREVLSRLTPTDLAGLSERQRRLCHMLVSSLVDQVPGARYWAASRLWQQRTELPCAR